mgnify:FL=1
MSDISILRWFLNHCHQNTDQFEVFKDGLRLLFYNDEGYYYLSIFKKSYEIMVFRYNKKYGCLRYVTPKSYWGDININNLEEFLETDDISLVLQYGRIILDDNVSFNTNQRYIDVTTSTAITLDELKGLME